MTFDKQALIGTLSDYIEENEITLPYPYYIYINGRFNGDFLSFGGVANIIAISSP